MPDLSQEIRAQILSEFRKRAKDRVIIRVTHEADRNGLHMHYYLFTEKERSGIFGVKVYVRHPGNNIIGIPSKDVVRFPDENEEEKEEHIINFLLDVADHSDTSEPWRIALWLQIDLTGTEITVGKSPITKLMLLVDLMSICRVLKPYADGNHRERCHYILLMSRLGGFLEEQFRNLNEALKSLSEFQR